MKKLEFKTSKGSFILSDENYYLVNERGVKTAYLNNKKQFEYVSFIRLSEITEEQASHIVGSVEERLYKDDVSEYFKTSIKSLHSLLKSKGVYLYKNPVKFPEYIDGYPDGYLDAIQQEMHLAEQKTFYNPVIFKL